MPVLLVAALSACSRPVTDKPGAAVPPASHSTVFVPAEGNYNAKGRVTKVNLPGGTIELDHEDIPGVMPRMIMEFNVREPKKLSGLKVGDSVDFVLEYKNHNETIVDISRSN